MLAERYQLLPRPGHVTVRRNISFLCEPCAQWSTTLNHGRTQHLLCRCRFPEHLRQMQATSETIASARRKKTQRKLVAHPLSQFPSICLMITKREHSPVQKLSPRRKKTFSTTHNAWKDRDTDRAHEGNFVTRRADRTCECGRRV